MTATSVVGVSISLAKGERLKVKVFVAGALLFGAMGSLLLFAEGGSEFEAGSSVVSSCSTSIISRVGKGLVDAAACCFSNMVLKELFAFFGALDELDTERF